ncbi:hypothetical protein MOUN0_O07316 [Monosporozyma unispora]|nr:hypothetical protein C6P44_001858 [Kazachstania unispora]
MNTENINNTPNQAESNVEDPTNDISTQTNSQKDMRLLQETKLLRDTLDLLWNKSLEQRKICEDLQHENEYLQDYINNLMSSSNVLEK